MSQGVQRRAWGRLVPTIHTHSLLYSYEADCVLTPKWLFKLHGYPDFADLQISGTAMRSLIGESWSLAAAAPAIYSLYLTEHGPWWKA